MLNSIKDIKNRPAASVTEPIALAEAKAWMIVDHTDDDALITRLIKEVRTKVESITKASLVEREIVLTIDLVRELKLPYGPVRSVDEVLYREGTNTDGTADYETLTAADGYTTDGEDFKLLKSMKCGRHKITYTTGYGTSEDPEWDCPVPDDLKNGILQEVAYRYEHRGDETNVLSTGGNETVKPINGISAGAMQYIRPYIQMANL